jgi:8-oxo-dGTP diphosphatase
MMNSNNSKYATLGDVDWTNWIPQQRATLLFVINDGQILLIHKKRGLGAGKINGPGGRIDPGESSHACAIREVQEELRVTPIGVEHRGVLLFQFVDGLSIHCEVFTATGCDGEPQETEEAIPIWTSLEQIPYDKMWADDRYWLPLMLAGREFEGRFLFDGDSLLGHELTVTS